MFLDSMEIPLSQESIDMPKEDIRCQTKVLERARPVQDLTMYDLQLRKVITPSSELRFWVFFDSMESPLSQEFIHMPEEIVYVRPRC